MKKTEFPTFLNEQPTVVFGRTSRELMVILIGIGLAYSAWSSVDRWLPGFDPGSQLLKILVVIIILGATVLVALVKVASRPLEEWALVGFFYYCTPKVFLYIPFDDDESSQRPGRGLRFSQVNEIDEEEDLH